MPTLKEVRKMELKDTINLMQSKDYKERFKAEYYQLKIRREKLMDFLGRWNRGAPIYDYYVTLGHAPQSLCGVALMLYDFKVNAIIYR